MKFSIKYFFIKCDQIRRKRICALLLKKSLIENFIFLCSERLEGIKNKGNVAQ